MTSADDSPVRLLERARAGDEAARGRLLESYRNFLRLVARSLINGALRARFDPSDVVQETFLKAHRAFDRFDGTTEAEFVAWLRRILVRDLADRVKHHRRRGRDLQRDESLEAALERSSIAVQRAGRSAGFAKCRGRASRTGRPARRRARKTTSGLSRRVYYA